MGTYNNEIFNDIEGFFNTIVNVIELFVELSISLGSGAEILKLIPLISALYVMVKVYKSLEQ